MTNSILCAVDIAHPGVDNPVLEAAARLAKSEDARLDVVTVVPDFGMTVVGGFFDTHHSEKALEAARAALHALTEEVLGEDQSAQIRHVVAMGSAYAEILKTAKTAGSDLIVVGAHKPDLKDYLLGPNAARVVRHADCSVFIVRS